MKMITSNSPVTTNGVIGQNDFTIVASAKAFKILSSSLYKNKILAVIRELSCNAYDSHVANGNPHTPFDVKLPTTLNSVFQIRDYGTGLSDVDIMELYTTYFNSTKTDSNDFTGALGLGSKSPFSYTTSFSVSSWHNGTLGLYMAYLDDNGMPKISKFSETPSTEPNGIQIEFLVDESDYCQFINNSKIVFEHFPVLPNMICSTDIALDPKTIEYSNDNWKINEYGQNSSVIMGNIKYPLYTTNITNFPEYLRCLNNIPLVINADIGDVDFVASREELSYDKRTCEYLIDIYTKVYDFLISEIKIKLDKVDSEWDIKVILCSIRYSTKILGKVVNNQFLYNDKLFDVSRNIDISEQFPKIGLSIFGENNNGNTTKTKVKSDSLSIKISKYTGIMFNDLSTNYLSRIKTYKEQNDYNRVYVFDNVDDTTTLEIIEALGNPSYELTSNIQLRKKPKNSNTFTILEYSPQYKKFYNDNSYTKSELDELDRSYYLEFTGLSPTLSLDVNTIIKLATDLKLIDLSDTDLIGLQKGVIKHVDTSKHVELIRYLKGRISNHKLKRDLEDYQAVHHDYNIEKSYMLNNIKDIITNNTIIDPDYILMLRQIESIYDLQTNIELYNLYTLNLGITQSKVEPTQLNYFEIIHKRYPLLGRILNSYWDKEEHYHEFEKYVNLVYEDNQNVL